MPRRIVTILEGESLFNDATALVTLAHGARRARRQRRRVLGRRRSTSCRAIVVGVVIGLGGRLRARPRCAGASSTTRCSTPRCRCSSPYVAYLAAEQLHGSGVLGGRRRRAGARAQARRTSSPQPPGSPSAPLWRTVQFVLENVVFLLIGLQLRTLRRAGPRQLPRAAAASCCLCLGVTATVIVVRVACGCSPLSYLQHLAARRAAHRAAAALAERRRPVVGRDARRGHPGRGLRARRAGRAVRRGARCIVAFSVVAGTLLVQGSTLPLLVRLLDVRGPGPRRRTRCSRPSCCSAPSTPGASGSRRTPPTTPRRTCSTACASWSERIAHSVWERLGTSDGRAGDADADLPPAAGGDAARRARQVVLDVHRSGKVPAEVLRGRDGAPRPGGGHARSRSARAPRTGAERPADAERGRGVRAPAVRAAGGGAEHPGRLRGLPARSASTTGCRYGCACAAATSAAATPRPRSTPAATTTRSGHPVMRSIELGEGWRWCFVDSVAA